MACAQALSKQSDNRCCSTRTYDFRGTATADRISHASDHWMSSATSSVFRHEANLLRKRKYGWEEEDKFLKPASDSQRATFFELQS